MSLRRRIAALVLVLAAGGLFATWYFGWLGGPDRPDDRLAGPDERYSNVMPEDYVGPQTCRKCHADQYDLWAKHPHRFMNQLVSKEAIKGDFDNHVWTVRPGRTVTFSVENGDYLMTVRRERKDGPPQRTQWKVTRTVGSRFLQFYVGVKTEGEEPRGDRVYHEEHKLPFAYWFRMKRWLPNDYFDVGDSDWHEKNLDGLPVVDGVDEPSGFLRYSTTCVHCHNTYPHVYRIFRPNLAGFFDAKIEGDYKRLSSALAPRISVAADADDFAAMAHRIDYHKELVTVGISCESCHLGGREHAENQGKKKISFFPTSPHVHVTPTNPKKRMTGTRDDPATSQGTCSQCHSAFAVGAYPNGVRVRNSSEARDLLDGACTTKIRCVDCHEPHTPGVPSGGPTPRSHLEACMGCHEQYASPEKAKAHSRHSEKANVDCLDCHMPRISQGVDEISRTHRISMPVEASMVSAGAPNACNLCHLDKTVNWTLSELKRGWNQEIKPLDKTPPENLEKPAGELWRGSKMAVTRMVAREAYVRSPLWKENLPEVLSGLDDHNPIARGFASFSVERLLGRRLAPDEYDVRGGPKQRQEQIERLRAILEKKR
jgi:hypothetical protein